MKIRPVEASDIPRIAPLLAQSRASTDHNAVTQELTELLKKRESAPVAGRLDHLLLAEDSQGAPVQGLLITGAPPSDCKLNGAFIHTLAVPSTSGGRRLATSLVNETKRHLMGSRVGALWIRTEEGHEIPFLRSGATVIGRAPGASTTKSPRLQLRLWISEAPTELETERLQLRDYRTADLPRWAELNAHALVNETLPGPLTRNQSDLLADRLSCALKQNGFGFWAVSRRLPEDAKPSFLGMVGLAPLEAAPQINSRLGGPAIEVAWRLHPDSWGNGYATEAAGKVLGWAADELGLKQVVAITVPTNVRSQALMKRLGFQRDEGGDFAHPKLPLDHALSRHWLFRKNL